MMKHSIRNTLILIFTLILLAGSGWIFIENKFGETIEQTVEQNEQLETELRAAEETASQFSTVQAHYNEALYTRYHFPKELLPDHSSSSLYDYLQMLNRDMSFTQLNYSFKDSVRNSDHGIIHVDIRGEGNYENLVNFIHRLEYSRPLVKIQSVNLDNITELSRLHRVNFQISLGAYYRRGDQWTTYDTTLYHSDPPGRVSHNPYHPLIHDVPPNDENLPDADRSRLVVLSGTTAHIIDQNGVLHRLSIGDRVYLGRLVSLNLSRGEAVFRLNRGGIADRVVLTLDS